MSDEILRISRQKLFDFLGAAFTDLRKARDNAKDDMDFHNKVEIIIDGLNRDILTISERRVDEDFPSRDKIEVDWS